MTENSKDKAFNNLLRQVRRGSSIMLRYTNVSDRQVYALCHQLAQEHYMSNINPNIDIITTIWRSFSIENYNSDWVDSDDCWRAFIQYIEDSQVVDKILYSGNL